MKFYFGLVFIIVFHCSCAQVSTPSMNDSIPVNPNTVRVKAKILSSTETQATLQIITVMDSGQGIINPLSEKQEVTVQLREPGKKFRSGKNITADLKEKLGVDNSQSSYVLVQAKE
jgi:hypothetical protein